MSNLLSQQAGSLLARRGKGAAAHQGGWMDPEAWWMWPAPPWAGFGTKRGYNEVWSPAGWGGQSKGKGKGGPPAAPQAPQPMEELPPVIWITLGSPSVITAGGHPPIAPALYHDGSDALQNLTAQAHQILACFVEDVSTEVEMIHDMDWSDFPEIGAALKQAGGKELSQCIARCDGKSKWAVGCGSQKKKRESVAKLALCIALSAHAENFDQVCLEFPDFRALCLDSGILPDTDSPTGPASKRHRTTVVGGQASSKASWEEVELPKSNEVDWSGTFEEVQIRMQAAADPEVGGFVCLGCKKAFKTLDGVWTHCGSKVTDPMHPGQEILDAWDTDWRIKEGMPTREEEIKAKEMKKQEKRQEQAAKRAQRDAEWRLEQGLPSIEEEALQKELDAAERQFAADFGTSGSEEPKPKKQPAVWFDDSMVASMQRDAPLWICLAAADMPPEMAGLPPEALALCTDGKTRKGLYSHVEDILSMLLEDKTGEVEYVDDANWENFPTVGQALKAHGDKEECMAVAICQSRSVWAVGVGGKGKVRFSAAKVALATSLYLQKEGMGLDVPDLTEFTAFTEFVREAQGALG
eukprot:gnl/TRDRNA2_/TRDRNA2_167476_c0_seq9.p1 gnl/TRDRNA2_/TRDRNA2_167476_c0~~gnl/TRDRNA2_/TRDRNA2_167476_c0_seq9.p1  ORF type:complete len:580 (+),score=116.00 gnl/TRDRNA2_/TRDRNA2_167476_c0_seq9:113-1852(+)